MNETNIIKGYEYAKEVYASVGIDVDKAIEKANSVAVTMHSWQGDDLIGFDGTGELTGGIATTGNYMGRARTADELRSDIDKVLTLIPGNTRVGIHSCQAETNGKNVDRDSYTAEMFKNWIDWAKANNLKLDFNPTFFSHKMMDGNFSLASTDETKRKFWVEHGKRCREIGAEFGKQLDTQCITNFWMPDGYKDIPADTLAPRMRMMQSLDEIFAHNVDTKYNMDALESKLFGLGIESYTVVSHEFDLNYCTKNNKFVTLDAGHFHPTESIASKLTAICPFVDGVMLHVSRGVRWDSDHVIVWDDELTHIMEEIILNGYENKVHIGLDYFDASINRIAAWTIGLRNARKSLLSACLTPVDAMRKAELAGDFTSRLALHEENKSLPFAPIWDYYCMKSGKPTGSDWITDVKDYERTVLSNRD